MVPRGEGRGLGERAGVGQHVLGDRQTAEREGSQEREVKTDGKMYERMVTDESTVSFLLIKNQRRRKGCTLGKLV